MKCTPRCSKGRSAPCGVFKSHLNITGINIYSVRAWNSIVIQLTVYHNSFLLFRISFWNNFFSPHCSRNFSCSESRRASAFRRSALGSLVHILANAWVHPNSFASLPAVHFSGSERRNSCIFAMSSSLIRGGGEALRGNKAGGSSAVALWAGLSRGDAGRVVYDSGAEAEGGGRWMKVKSPGRDSYSACGLFFSGSGAL